ncbi:MAG: hypothetical protein JJT89_09915 [Nitriliruptoraceae bacterium]|nr:hypothetical protein [Nitriliruptoraceae bacterium]
MRVVAALTVPPTPSAGTRPVTLLPDLAQSSPGGVPATLIVLVVLATVGVVAWASFRQRARLREGLATLIGRSPGWRLTVHPCDVTPELLAGRTAATPRGDRRYGVRHGVEGPTTVTLGGEPVEARIAMFEWTYEERRTSRSNQGTRTTTYHTRTELVALCRLPTVVPRAIRIGAESVLGRVGLTRGGQQVESSEFNRRFRVEGRDPRLTVQLLDPTFQQLLLDAYQGRTIHLDDDLVVLGGRPDHRDESLPGIVGLLPAARQDLERLVRSVPAQFWRAIGPSSQGDAWRPS